MAEKKQDAPKSAAGSDFLRKITMKGIGATPDMEALIAAPGKRMVLAKIFGIVRKAKPEMGKEGRSDYVRFYGQFKAINLETGETFASGALILPGVVQDQLYGALGDEVQGIEFAVEVGAKYDPEAVTKYVYFAKSLIAPKETDPLMQLESRLKDQKLLAAPK